ncbi:MAG: NADH-quinone oxidoreductase subunit M [Dehalococcoidia bacterium]
MLTLFLVLPLVGAIVSVLMPKERDQDAKWLALGFSGAAFVVSIMVFALFDARVDSYQFVDTFEWISAPDAGFVIRYTVGVDGLSVPLVLLLGLLTVVSVLVSWRIEVKPRQYFAWLLLMETSVAGVFLSLDLIQFFLFWELELLPMFMLISQWGSGRRLYSATKFLLYTLAGSAFMLVGFLVLGAAAGTYEIADLVDNRVTEAAVPLTLVFWAIMLAFLVKLPTFPLHTWLPDAHTDAPTAVSVMLAGVLLKMGGYGILRIALPILPQQAHDSRVILATLAGFSVIWGAVITLRQTDLKRLVAYSSVSHMGYVLLGVSALGPLALSGAAMQMFTHGTITGLLFVVVGLIYDRTHTREIAQMSGLLHRMPLVGSVMIIAGLASLGLPGMSGFVAELTTFLGSLEAHPVATTAAIFGVVLSAGYILWTVQRVLHGPQTERWRDLTDATAWWEVTAMASLVIVILAVGIFPSLLTNAVEAGVAPIARIVGGIS